MKEVLTSGKLAASSCNTDTAADAGSVCGSAARGVSFGTPARITENREAQQQGLCCGSTAVLLMPSAARRPKSA